MVMRFGIEIKLLRKSEEWEENLSGYMLKLKEHVSKLYIIHTTPCQDKKLGSKLALKPTTLI